MKQQRLKGLLINHVDYVQIFTGIFPRHYDPPDGFTFEINDVSPPIQVSLQVKT